MPRKVALCAVMLCAALAAGCMAEGEVLPTAAEVGPVIQERGAVAQQYWAATQAFQRAPLGFKVRLEAAIGRFTACSPGGAGNQDGSAGGEWYQIIASWEPVGLPSAEQAGLLHQAVPVVERAFNDAGWSQFQPSTSSGIDVVATRRGITMSLDADPANPAPLERDWIPAESYTVAGPCMPVAAPAATEFGTVGEDSYGTAPTALFPIDIRTSGTSRAFRDPVGPPVRGTGPGTGGPGRPADSGS